MKELQKSQNKLLRVLTGQTKLDHAKISDMLSSLNVLSVNQTAAQIKLTEMWKALNDSAYPLKMELKSSNGMVTRSSTRGEVVEFGSSSKTIKSFYGSATRLWNQGPVSIRQAQTLNQAKEEIKKFCRTLPI